MCGDHWIDQSNKASPGYASQNVTRTVEKILMHSTDSEVFQCRTHQELAGLMRTTMNNCSDGW